MTDKEIEILRKGEKTEAQAGVNSIVWSVLLVGPIAIIAKIIRFGWIALSWKDYAYGQPHIVSKVFFYVLFFVLEGLGIIIASSIILYIVIKPFDAIYRNTQKKKITEYEKNLYEKLKKEKVTTVTKKPTKYHPTLEERACAQCAGTFGCF